MISEKFKDLLNRISTSDAEYTVLLTMKALRQAGVKADIRVLSEKIVEVEFTNKNVFRLKYSPACHDDYFQHPRQLEVHSFHRVGENLVPSKLLFYAGVDVSPQQEALDHINIPIKQIKNFNILMGYADKQIEQTSISTLS